MFTIENPIKIKFECQLTYLRCLCCALLLYVAYLFAICVSLNISSNLCLYLFPSQIQYGFVTLNSIN